MLADFLAATATPTPMPTTVHDAYDWWSDIVLPALVGVGSIAAAAAAVVVAWRSNKLAGVSAEAAQAATAAAERSNELAHQALLHERDQAKVVAARVEADERGRFADRVTARFDQLFSAQERWSEDAHQHIREIGTLALEAIASGWLDLGLNDWVVFSLRVSPANHDERSEYFSDQRQAVHTMMASWVKNPDSLQQNQTYFERKLRLDYPNDTDA